MPCAMHSRLSTPHRIRPRLCPGGLQAALDIQAGPIEVWSTRDYLVSLARAHGTLISRFSRLSDAMLSRAQHWFGSWVVPEV